MSEKDSFTPRTPEKTWFEVFVPQELAIHLQQVGPLVRPVIDELRIADQAIDQLVGRDLGVAKLDLAKEPRVEGVVAGAGGHVRDTECRSRRRG